MNPRLNQLLIVGLLGTSATHAADLYVDSANGVDVGNCQISATPCKTIEHSINNSVAGDTINLISTTGVATTYNESELNIDHDLTIRGSGIYSSEIDALGTGRVFNITAGDVVIDRVTLRNGDAGLDAGGGINFTGGNLVVSRTQILDSVALTGGGIAAHDTSGELLVIASNIRANIGTAGGGGIWCDSCGGVDIGLSAISENLAGANGGALYATDSDILVARSYMKNNNADSGGAIYTLNGSTTIAGSEVSDNEADAANGGAAWASGTLDVQRTSMANNTANEEGGALFVNDGSTLLASNSTFSNNSALVGGAFALDINLGFGIGPNVLVTNSTFYNNESTFAGAGEHISGAWGSFELYNSIITNDPAAVLLDPICFSALTDGTNNLIDDASCNAPTATFNLGVVSGFDQNLAYNGGSTRTHALTVGSNAIDTANNASCRNPSTGFNLIYDQRRNTRPTDGDLNGIDTCDIGAFEFQ